MHFKLKIECDNEAFLRRPDLEVARILTQLARVISRNGRLPTDVRWPLLDFNGNTVGHAEAINDDPGEETCEVCGLPDRECQCEFCPKCDYLLEQCVCDDESEES